MGGKRIKGLKARVGCECSISRRGPDGSDWAVEVYQLEESEQEVIVLVDVGSPKRQRRCREGSSRSVSCQEF